MKSSHLFFIGLKQLLLGLFVFCFFGHLQAQNGPDCANSLCFGPGTSYSANSDLTITANQYYSYMQIKTNRTLTVKAGFTLYVGPVGTGAETEVFDLQNNGIIIVESGATLVINGKLNNSNNSTDFTVDGTMIVYGNVYSGNGTQIVGTGSVSATGTITGGGTVLGTPATCSTGPCNSCTPLANSISSSQSYCTATIPTALVGSAVSGATYQWAKSTTSSTIGFANISGATSKDYSPTSVSSTTYFIRYATVGTCVYVSNVATVSIGSSPLSITTHPATGSGCEGVSKTLSVVASGASVTYQWEVNTGSGFSSVLDGGVYSGATTSSLTISNVTGLSGYIYRVIVSSTCGTPLTVTSSQATLTVNVNPTSAVLANGSGSNFKCYGSTMNLKTTVTGGLANFKVKYTNGVTVDSVTNYVSGNDFVITPVLTGSYSLVSVTDANGCLSQSNSSTAAVTVTTTTTISSSLDGTRCGAGTVSIQATPSAGTVRWYTTPTGGTSIGSGSPFTTPTITTTTSYYAEAFNTPCVSVTRRKVTAFVGTSLSPIVLGTGTFTIPAGVTTMSVQCWGGGGGGGGARETNSNTGRGGGGAGGAYASVNSLTVSAGQVYDFSVGIAGTAGVGNGNGGPGGDSYFVLSGVDKVRAKGGTFGSTGINANGNGGTAALSTASVGTVRNAGGNGATATNSGSGGGGGAAGAAGAGGVGTVTTGGASQSGGSDKGGNGLTANAATGNSGVGVGAGGGGAFANNGANSGSNTTAGAGQAGRIIITIPAPTISYTGSPYCKSLTSATVTVVGILGWQFIAPAGLTIDAATGEINPSTSTAGTYQVIYRDPCGAPDVTTNVTISESTQWTGATSKDWATTTNWSCGQLPTSAMNVTLPTGLVNYPEVANASNAVFKDLTIQTGASLTTLGTGSLEVFGNWSNAGTYNANTGTVEFVADVQTITNTNSGTESFYNLSLNGTGTKTISSGTNVNILPSGSLTFASGITLDVNNQTLTLKSGVSVAPDYLDNTARLVAMPSGATFTNASNFKVERYIAAGKRTVRFLSSPVSGATVANWNNAFYITGSKAIYPDNAILGSTLTTVSDYTETLNGLSSQKFTEVYGLGTNLVPGKGYRAFIRGGRDIDTNPAITPTATATTLSVTGIPNVGDITRNLTYTNNSKPTDDGWNLVGNPYASQIDWDLVSVSDRVNVSNSFSIFDPRLGTNGAYYTYVGGGVGTPARSNPSIIPSSQAFFVKLTSPGVGSITFKEFQKSTLSHRGNFRMAHDNLLRIGISDTGTYDETVVQFLDGSTLEFDSDFDAQKLSNAGINIFTVSSKGDNLAINRIPLESSMNIRLGVSNRFKGLHTLKFSNDPSFAEAKLYLEDKYLRKVTEVVDGGEYSFDITSDVNSSGTDRFVLTNQPTVLTSTDESLSSGNVAMKVYPNPTDGKHVHLDLYASMQGNLKLKIMDLTGKVVFTRDLGNANGLSFSQYVINDLSDLANGVYVVNCEGETSNFKSIFTISK